MLTEPLRHWAFALLPLILASTIYSGAAIEALWTSDDYFHAKDAIEKTELSWHSLWRQGSRGRLGVTRLLNYPLVGAVPWYLGAIGSHALAVGVHAVNSAMVALLGFQLGLKRPYACFAGCLFAASLWAAQPVVWWSSAPAAVATAFMLGAMLTAFRWFRHQQSGSLATGCILCFGSLCFYEQWLAGWIAFLSIGLVAAKGKLSRRISLATPFLLPFAIWVVARALTFPADSNVHQPSLDLTRIPVVFASVQLRMLHWLVDPEWLPLIRQGWAGLAAYPLLPLLGVTLGSALIWRGVLRAAPSSVAPETPMLQMLLVAWVLFLGARLIYILQGGIALESRHSYGATVGLAIAAASVFQFLPKKIAVFLVLPLLTFLALACAGQAHHYATFTRLEEDIYRLVLPKIEANPKRPIIVMTQTNATKGEMKPYGEGEGRWLRFRLKDMLHEPPVQVMPQADLTVQDQANALILDAPYK